MEAQRKTNIIGSLAIAFSAVLWGFDGVVLTPRLYNLDVGYVVFILHLFPFLLMSIFFNGQFKYLFQMKQADIITFLLISFFGGAVGTIAIVKALFLLNFNHLSIVVLLQKLQPIFAIILATTILGEKLRKNYFLWATVAISSGYFLTFGWSAPNINKNPETIYASLLALLAAFSFGSSTVFSKKILGNYSYVTSTFYRYGFTSVIMLIYMLIWGKFDQFNQTTPHNWLFIILIGITTGSGAIFLYYYGLRKVKAIMATISELMFPISAVLLDYFINDSLLSPIQWVAGALMIFSIIRLNSSRENV